MLIYINPNEKTKMTNPVLSIENVIDNPDIKWNVAKNPNTPVETLKVLATDEDSYVRCSVARNPNKPVKTLNLLATDEAKAPDGYVEVDLQIDLTYNLPYRNTNGLLDFRTFTPEEASSITKVFVPMEATESKKALKAYVSEVMEYGNTDIICVDNVNIWNEKENEFVYE